jgi:hypothetical protein
MSPRKKKTETYTPPENYSAFQITQEDLDACPLIDNKYLGKWGFMRDGFYAGFFNSKEKAEKWIEELNNKLY